MGKPIVTLWTCCNAIYSVDENKSTASKLFGKFRSRKEKEPIKLHRNGPCPECVRRALELREEGKKARDQAEELRYERAEAALRQQAASGLPNTEDWDRALGPRHAALSFKEETPKRSFTFREGWGNTR